MIIISDFGAVCCLFCNTGSEDKVVRIVQEYGLGRAIFARRVKNVRKKGSWSQTLTPLLPGYVFVYMDADVEDVHAQCHEMLRLKNVIKLLTYDDGAVELTGHDLEFAQLLWRLDGQLDVMKAVQIGDYIEIVDGVFKQLHGKVVRMDRRRRTLCVELETIGTLKHIWLAYDVVQKFDKPSKNAQDGVSSPG